MKGVFWLSLVVFFQPSVSAAETDDYVIERIQHPDFIPGFIASIAQDHSGFMWFATSDGLFRYDGVRFVVFKSEVRNPLSLPNNNIRYVYVDSNGTLWALTQGGGLSRYNPMNQTFDTFLRTSELTEAVAGTFDFWTIFEADNSLYISSHGGNGFFRFNLETHTFDLVELPSTDRRHFIQTSSLIKSEEGDIWIGTDESGIVILSDYDQISTLSIASGHLSSDRVRSIFQASDGTIWAGTIGGGVAQFDSETRTRRSNVTALKVIPGLHEASVYSFFEDPRSNIWIASSIGLIVYNHVTNRVVNHYVYDPGNPRSLSSSLIRSIYQDRSGVIWAGTQNAGLNKLTIRQRFINIVPQSRSSEGILNNPIVRSMTIYQGELWIGTEAGGINIADLAGYNLLRVKTSGGSDYPGLQSNEITTFAHDPDGGLWVGTWGGGLHYFDPIQDNFTPFRHQPDDSLSISDDRIQFLYIDSSGRYWVGTENGLNRFNREEGTFYRIKHDPDDPSTLSGNSLQTLGFLECSPGVFWVASWQGLNRFDSHTGKVQRFISDPVNPNTISSNHVISLLKDGEYLWMGTFGGGLNRLNVETGDIDIFTEATGLPNNVIFAILQDQDDYLWLSSSRGLSKFDTATLSFVNYTESDGLQGNDFWWGSAYKDEQGKLYFGGTNGLTILDPRSIVMSDYEPAVNISSVSINSEAPALVKNGDFIILEPGYNALTVEFASLDFSDPLKNQYAYMLEGLSREWTYTGNRSIVSFASLPPGSYTFRVRGTNSAGDWSSNQAELFLVVKPMFYQTLLFQLMAILLLAGLISGGVLNWTRLARQRQAELRKLVDERTRDLAIKQEELLQSYAELHGQAVKLKDKNAQVASQNALILAKSRELESINRQLLSLNQEKNSLIGIVAHDLRSPAASVMSALQLLQLQPELTRDEQLELFNMMEDFLNKQLSMVSRILDNQALETGVIDVRKQTVDVTALCMKLTSDYNTKATLKDIQVKSELKEERISAETDPALLEQILDNLLSNAIKFSPQGSTVNLILQRHENYIRLGVKDQGPGLTKDDQSKLFGKFQRLSARPTADEQSTGLGLSIVKRFVDALNGSVYCDSVYGEGATFWVEIPK